MPRHSLQSRRQGRAAKWQKAQRSRREHTPIRHSSFVLSAFLCGRRLQELNGRERAQRLGNPHFWPFLLEGPPLTRQTNPPAAEQRSSNFFGHLHPNAPQSSEAVAHLFRCRCALLSSPSTNSKISQRGCFFGLLLGKRFRAHRISQSP